METRKFVFLRQVLLAATLTVGFATLWFGLVGWIVESIARSRGGEKWPPRENLVVTVDGTPLIETTRFDDQDQAQMTYRDLNGDAHESVDRKDHILPISVSGKHTASHDDVSLMGWERRIKAFMDERDPSINWYFIHDGEHDGSGYFVGYRRPSNRRIGYLGLSGFRSDLPPAADRIPVRGELMIDHSFWSSAPLWSHHSSRNAVPQPNRTDLPPRLVHVPSGNLLRVVDLGEHTVATAFEATEPIVAVGVPTLMFYYPAHVTGERPILVRTPRKIYVLNHQYKIVREFAIPPEIDPRSSAAWFDLGDGRAIVELLLAGARQDPVGDSITRTLAYRVASDGTIREQFPLELKNGATTRDRWVADVIRAVGLAGPAPFLALGPLNELLEETTYAKAVFVLLQDSWPYLTAVLIASAILGLIAWRRSQAFGLSPRGQITWAAFVLLLGLPGFVGFLLSRRWPPRESCPNCRAQAPRDRDTCSACGVFFPAPPLKGIEIYA